MQKKIFHFVLFAGIFGIIAWEFFCNDATKGHDQTQSWSTFLSMTVLLMGCFYALLERSIVVGVVTLVATLFLPFVMNWIILYWPWVKNCYLSLGWVH